MKLLSILSTFLTAVSVASAAAYPRDASDAEAAGHETSNAPQCLEMGVKCSNDDECCAKMSCVENADKQGECFFDPGPG